MKTDAVSNFFSLSPDAVMTAVEKSGYLTTGEFYQLNSYENRVFDIKLEKDHEGLKTRNVIAKFYRPQRWSREALGEEHGFLYELLDNDVPVVAPLKFASGSSIETLPGGIFYSLFPKTLGRMPQEFIGNELETVGRLLARLHNVGAQSEFRARPTMGTASHLGWNSLTVLKKWVTPELWTRYHGACQKILGALDDMLEPRNFLRIHGDCHKGNILSNDRNFFFVDFDDAINGPAVQDFWMLLSGDGDSELDQLLSGYTELRDFDESELDLIPALRGLRIFSYAAWIANRWEDPSFPRLFPTFNSYVYWAEEVEALEKVAWNL